MNDVLIVSITILPMGKFDRVLREMNDWELGTIVIREALKRVSLREYVLSY